MEYGKNDTWIGGVLVTTEYDLPEEEQYGGTRNGNDDEDS